MRRPIPTQQARTFWLVVYLAALLFTYHLMTESWFPPVGGEGLWFYTAAVSLLLGDLVIYPYYVGPKDSLTYAIPSAIAVWLAIQGGSDANAALAYGILAYCLLIASASAVAMLLGRTKSPRGEWLSNTLKEVSKTVGHPKVLLSGVFLFALIVFHMGNPKEILLVGGTWAVLIGVQPERPLYWAWQKLRAGPGSVTDFGGVVGYQTPGILLVRRESKKAAGLGTLLVCKDASGPLRLTVALDYTGRDEALLLRSLEVDIPSTEEPWIEGSSRALGPDRVGKVSPDEIPPKVKGHVPILKHKNNFLGIVSENTDVQRLYFEVISERDIEEGHL